MKTPSETLPLPEIYYLPADKSYWIKDDKDKWITVNEGSAKARIRLLGYSGKNQHGVGEDTCCRLDLQSRQNIAYAGALAGYRAGPHRINENEILVTEAGRPVRPRAGEWPTLQRLFEGMFRDPEHDQLVYFYGWLKLACETVQAGAWQPGQALALAGPVGCGKSLTQRLITELLGGRSAKPYQSLTGATNFNGDLFRAEHLMVEDETESIDIRARRHFAAGIKGIAVNQDQHCQAKHRTPLILTPIWRLTISLNNDPERLLVLPPLDPDVADKIILLKVGACEMPMPTATHQEQAAFWQTLTGELPAFVAFLQSWLIPDELRSPRFGITHFHHPDLVETLRHTSPEHRLLEMIDSGISFTVGAGITIESREVRAWEGSALELERRLTGDKSPVSREASKLLTYQTTCGTLLGRLEHTPGLHRVSSRPVNGVTQWTVQPPRLRVGSGLCSRRVEEEAEPSASPSLPPGLALAA